MNLFAHSLSFPFKPPEKCTPFKNIFQDQSDFPGLFRSWKFSRKSRTFRETWEPCISYSQQPTITRLPGTWLTTAFQSQMWSVDDFSLTSTTNLRSASSFFVVPRHSLSLYGCRAFAVADQTAWNSPSNDLHDPTLGTDSFRRRLKTRLFSEY